MPPEPHNSMHVLLTCEHSKLLLTKSAPYSMVHYGTLTSKDLILLHEYIPHKYLLSKLQGYSIQRNLLSWIEAFF